jgi:hypothetical protein
MIGMTAERPHLDGAGLKKRSIELPNQRRLLRLTSLRLHDADTNKARYVHAAGCARSLR